MPSRKRRCRSICSVGSSFVGEPARTRQSQRNWFRDDFAALRANFLVVKNSSYSSRESSPIAAKDASSSIDRALTTDTSGATRSVGR